MISDGPPPVLGPLGVEFVDALLAWQDEHDESPSWDELAGVLGISGASTRQRAWSLRDVGVLTWAVGAARTLDVVGRYREWSVSNG